MFKPFALVLLILAFSQLQATEPIKLPVPAEWRVENTSYPPPWAQTLPWKGTIQLRFPKSFFDSDSDYFWSYPILYQLRGDVITNTKELKRALLEYDAGLYGNKYPKEKIKITLRTRPADERYPVIIVDGFDPFTTNKPLRTWIVYHRRYEKQTDTTTILLLRSSQPYDPENDVWKTLRTLFRSHAGF